MVFTTGYMSMPRAFQTPLGEEDVLTQVPRPNSVSKAESGRQVEAASQSTSLNRVRRFGKT